MKTITICFILISYIVFSNAVLKNYTGYKLYKAVPKSEKDVKVLTDIQISGIGEFWNEYFRLEDDVRIMVAPEQNTMFLNRLQQSQMKATLVFENLQEVINKQNVRAQTTSDFLSMSWDRYHDLNEIYNWLDELVEAYPNIVSPVVMGTTSVENRQIRGIKIDYHPDRPDRKFGFLEGTLHAREWISPATVTWMVKEFLTSSDPAVRAMAEDLEWHIFPVVNPDGYVYTFTDNRMWRKNRSTANFTTCATANDDMSNGVDLNRNFDFVWMTIGASSDPCSNTFAGPAPASEPETRAIAEYVLNLHSRGQIVYYLSFHSYTQLFIIPYSHVSTNEVLTVNNYADMYEIAIRSAEKVSQRYGTTYRVGISAEVLYPMSGSSFDWVKYRTDASVSYLIELRDMGEFGFLLPASQIIPNNLEVMDGIIEMDKTTRRLGYYTGASGVIVNSLSLVFLGLLVAFNI